MDKKQAILRQIVVAESGCWLWQGGLDAEGYPNGRQHRRVCTLWKGPIPNGYEVDHLCFVTACVNPDHLEAVPKEVNQARSRNRGSFHHNGRKTHCKHGHPWNAENTAVVTRPSGRTERRCRACYRWVYGRKGKTGILPNRLKTHCNRGHPLSGENLKIMKWRGAPSRQCRQCRQLHRNTFRQRLKQKAALVKLVVEPPSQQAS